MFALGVSLVSGANNSFVYDSLKENKQESSSKKIFGRIGSIQLVSFMVGAIIGGIIADSYGVRYTMGFLAIPLALSGLAALLFKEPRYERVKNEKYKVTLKKGFSYFKNHKILRIIAVDYAVIGALSFFLIWVYQVVLTDLNVEIKQFGFIHAMLLGVQILVMNNFSFLEKISQSKKIYLVLSGILAGSGFLLIALAMILENLTIAIFGILVTAAFGLTRKNLFQSYLNKHIDSEYRATVLSSVSMFYSGPKHYQI